MSNPSPLTHQDIQQRLEPLVAEWRNLKAKANSLTEKQAKEKANTEAEAYYHSEVLPLVAQNARLLWHENHEKIVNIDVLISVLGFSPATSVISTTAVQPKHLILITSNEANEGIDKISSAVLPDMIAPRNLHHHRCDPTAPLDIYEKIKSSLEEIQTAFPNRKVRAMIDITGGKKVMSAAASLVAWRLNLPLCYIESSYDPSLRMPRPGTEHLIFLDNPINIYRQEEITTAIQIFNAGHFTQAETNFQFLADHLSNPIQARFMAALSRFYAAWCDLNFKQLSAAAQEVEQQLPEALRYNALTAEHHQNLRTQLRFASKLAERDPATRLIALYLLGRHYGWILKRLDFSALFFYRTIEGCLAERLCQINEIFRKVPVDFSKLDCDLDELLNQYNSVAEIVGMDQRECSLPTRLGLMNTAGLLLALGDKLLVESGFHQKQGLNKLKALSEIRNGSILAHGYRSIHQEDCDKLAQASVRLLQHLFRLSNWDFPSGDFKTTCSELEFLKISEE